MQIKTPTETLGASINGACTKVETTIKHPERLFVAAIAAGAFILRRVSALVSSQIGEIRKRSLMKLRILLYYIFRFLRLSPRDRSRNETGWHSDMCIQS